MRDVKKLTPHEKIAVAKQLLIEATRELRTEQRATEDAHVCTCGHRRNEHTVSYDINYTGGFCMRRACPCRHFLMADL